ncbi:MAG: OsmC family protein [Lentimicrobiaceae bacterium]|nr:OsmC family protein [Lentimicrobiaceae bacterium]
MESLSTKYLGNLRTEVEHVASGAKIITDAPLDNHGKGDFFSPTDLFAASYGCCALTIMGIAAQTHGFNIDGAEVKTTKIMGNAPRRVVELAVAFTFPHNRYSAKERRIIELSSKECPVANSLDPALKITRTIVYKDEES